MANMIKDGLTDDQLIQKVTYQHYPTPSQFVRQALRYVLNLTGTPVAPRILDYSCGTGVWNAVWHELVPNSYRVNVELQIGAPIRLETAAEWHYGMRFQDWAAEQLGKGAPRFDIIAGNPPFQDGQEFIEWSEKLINRWGCHIHLLPINFLSTQERTETLHRVIRPYRVATIPKRLSFTKNGKTDDKEYALFIYKGKPDMTELDFSFDWSIDEPDLPEDSVFDGVPPQTQQSWADIWSEQ